MGNVGIKFIIFVLVITALVYLQVFLSGRKNKWLGLILPGIFFIYSIFGVLQMGNFENITAGEIILFGAMSFMTGNVPTVVLLGIYFEMRKKLYSPSRIEKMNIKDLYPYCFAI